MTSFIQANVNCFSRDLKAGHLTGSAWILDSTGTRALLTHHKKLNIWVQPGGHADGDSDISRVAYREALEESGLTDLRLLKDNLFDIDIHSIPARADEPEHLHYDCRFLLQTDYDDYVVSDESHDLSWVLLTEMENVTREDSVLRMVRKTTS
jgi:8-oxo-dGTP pyrophosphatase MutT (NUDIX family)